MYLGFKKLFFLVGKLFYLHYPKKLIEIFIIFEEQRRKVFSSIFVIAVIIIDKIDTYVISELQKVPNLYNVRINDLENQPNSLKI